LLTRLAAVSGGLALVVKNEGEISAATEQIIHRLKSQYTIGYYSTNDKRDGSFRNVRVTVTPKDKRRVKVFAPSGYYTVGPEKIREETFNDRK
jgi:Ca-activated chloride channel family protein